MHRVTIPAEAYRAYDALTELISERVWRAHHPEGPKVPERIVANGHRPVCQWCNLTAYDFRRGYYTVLGPPRCTSDSSNHHWICATCRQHCRLSGYGKNADYKCKGYAR